ncbi:MAG: hypothetical protein RQ756_04465, partial [Flavobacteriaceae bacterium]|nr:hypothetical protein [Flavobacteriaceae bacterium]
GGTLSDIAIDDVLIEEATLCPKPINLGVQNLGVTVADLVWTDNGAATLWDVEWGLAGFTPTGTPSPNAAGLTVETFPLTGLTTSTDYSFYVRADCGPDGFSNWSGPFTFTTAIGCGGTYVDNGGATGPYLANSDEITTICPDTPGEVVTVTFNSFQTETNWDALYVFDGPDINAPLIDSGNPAANVPGGVPGGFWGTTPPGPFTSNHPSGCLTFRFRSDASVQQDGWVASVTCSPAPTCFTPQGLSASNFTPVGADLEWTENNTGVSLWDVEVVLAGTTPTGTPTDAGVTQNPYTKSGLLAATAYDFYVRSDCGATDGVSDWAGPFTFQTECDTIPTPHVQNFTSFTVAPFVNIVEELCWEQPTTPNVGFGWRVTNAATGSANTGPDAAFVAPNYIFLEAGFPPNGSIAELITPLFDLNPLAVPALKFHYHMFGANIGALRVDIRNVTAGTGFDNDVFVLTGQQQTSGSAPWVLAEIGLGAYAGDVIQVRFRGEHGNGTLGDIAFDDFRIEEATTCPQPINLGALNITPTTADLDWTENGSATVWDVEVVLAGATPTGTPTNVNPIVAIPYQATGLLAATAYDFYVRADCGAVDGFSNWSGPFSFQTECDIIPTPHVQNFTGFTVAPFVNIVEELCWEQPPTVNTGFGWRVTNAPTGSLNTGPTGAFVPPNYIFLETSAATVGAIAELISPLFDLSTLSAPALKFHYHMFGPTMGNLRVDVRNVTAGTPFDNDVFVLTGQQQTAETDPWELAEIGLGAYAGDVIQVRFRGERGTSFESDMSIDDFRIEEATTCPQPINLGASNFTPTTADLQWTENGSATVWDVEVVTTGSTPTGTPTNVNPILAIPYQATGLTAATSYDFYVRADCDASAGSGGQSNWSGPFTFQTECDIIPTPHLQQFTGFTVAPLTNIVEELCWEQPTTPNVGFGWRTTNAATGTANTGPNAALSPPNYVFLEAGFPPAGSIAELISPLFDLSTLTTPALKFHYHMFGTNIGALRVDIRNVTAGTPFDNDVFVLTGQQQTSGSDPWVLAEVGLGAYAGDVIQVRFRGQHGGGTLGDIAMDDFRIEEATICPQPINLGAQNVGVTDADIFWTENGSATIWDVEWGLAGFTPTGTPSTGFAGLVATTANLSGLTTSTDYSFYVRADCGPDGFSNWSGPFTFTTAIGCGGTFVDNGGIAGNYLANSDEITTICPDTPGELVTVTFTSFQTETNWDALYVFDGPDITALQISSGNPANNVPGGVPGGFWGATPPGPFTSTHPSGCLTFRFRSDGSVQQAGWVADVTCSPAPTCFQPQALTASNFDIDSADLAWTEMGTATLWDVEIVLAGTAPTGVPTDPGVTNPFTATGLTAATQYDYYVRADCGPDGVSAWSGPFTFSTTICLASDICNYTFRLTDSFGDGWNGNTMDIIQNGITVATIGGTFTTGNGPVDVTVPLCSTFPFDLFWNT